MYNVFHAALNGLQFKFDENGVDGPPRYTYMNFVHDKDGDSVWSRVGNYSGKICDALDLDNMEMYQL